MNHSMKLQSKLFDRVAAGKKTIEVRLFDEKRKQIRVGDTITFTKQPHNQDQVMVKVEKLEQYQTFQNLYHAHAPHKYGGGSAEELINQIYQYYSKEDEGQYGVLAIMFSCVMK